MSIIYKFFLPAYRFYSLHCFLYEAAFCPESQNLAGKARWLSSKDYELKYALNVFNAYALMKVSFNFNVRVWYVRLICL